MNATLPTLVPCWCHKPGLTSYCWADRDCTNKLDMVQKMHPGPHVPPLDGRVTKYCLYIMITALTLTTAAYPLCPHNCHRTIMGSRELSTFPSLHKDCYMGKTPTLCQSPGVPRAKYWTEDITKLSVTHVTTRASREGSELATLTFLNGESRTGEGCTTGPFKKL